MRHSVGHLLALYLFWLVLSGYFTAFLLSAGAASALAVLLFCRRMDRFGQAESRAPISGIALLAYFAWLLGEIAKSAWDVSLRILDPRLPISPALVRFCPSQRTEVGLVIHANSITLTPGTISVEVGRDEFLVHALSASAAAGLPDSEMDRRISRLERARG